MKSPIEEQANEVQKWLKTQPQLPQNIDFDILTLFVRCMNGNVEEAKRLLELNYQMRSKYDHIFLKRDPMDESSQNILKVVDFLEMPGKTSENDKIVMYRIADNKPEKFIFTDCVRMLYTMADCRFKNYVQEDVSGEIIVFEMNGFSLKHLARLTLSSLRIAMKFLQEAHPVNLKSMHVLNSPPYMDKVMGVFRPFMSTSLLKVLHFHAPNAETPYKYFPRDLLPEEYGGKAGKLSDLREYWLKKLEENRSYLIDESKWRGRDSKTRSSYVEITEHIRKLEID